MMMGLEAAARLGILKWRPAVMVGIPWPELWWRMAVMVWLEMGMMGLQPWRPAVVMVGTPWPGPRRSEVVRVRAVVVVGLWRLGEL
jgi:hypothetical protein